MIYLYSYIYVNNFQYLPVTNYKNDDPNIPTYRLTFIGDSLIHRPFTEFDLGGRLQRHFRSINLDIIDNARNGQEIAKCQENIYKDVPMNSSDMVILFWDSDCSNIDESILNQDQINEIRANYRSNLTQVIEAVKAAGVKYMAVSGPNLLGEGPNSPLRHVFFPSFVNDKTNMLNAYRAMNMEIAEELGVDYIDMRKIFLRALPNYWILPAYHLTLDGEHPNDRGTGIIAEEFAKQISIWFDVTMSYY
eukprot:gene12614-13806_t